MENPKTLTLAELHRLSRPLTGASSLNINRPIKPQSNPTPTNPLLFSQKSPNNNNNNITKTLNSLNYPTIISGTLSLPSPATSSYSLSSFSFTDGTFTLSCDILGFSINVLGVKIHVTAWNFIPYEKNGFLEIINWEFDGSRNFHNINVDSFNIGSGDIDVKARYFVRGGLVSVSPVYIVPCSTGSGSKSTNVSGFLANLLICGCKLCISKDSGMGLGKDHSFVTPVIVYFCGLNASLWRPVIVKLLGRVVSLEYLKKKMVFIGEEESQLMYVTSEKSLLHVSDSAEKWDFRDTVVVKGKGECGSYTGSVTGVYMKGMVVELDHKVVLVVTDQLVVLPLSVRVGAIVTIRNAHFVNPNFSWTKILILGACFRTSVCLESFSPFETGCCIYSHSQSLLGNFIDSLVYSARLWVLLLVSSFRKKFVGFLSENEILGSKHRKGIVQSFATSHLPSSVFRSRHGLFREYCKHESCGCANDPLNIQLKLVAPILNVVAHCNATWMKGILEQDAGSEFTYECGQSSTFSCDGVHCSQRFRSMLQSYEMGVSLLGFLKFFGEGSLLFVFAMVCPTSGRLQLSDSTGSIDVFLPDLSSTLDVNNIYVVNDFTLVTEGTPEQENHLEMLSDVSFSCKSIFTGLRCKRAVEVEMYIFCHLRDTKLLDHSFSPVVENSESIVELQNGLFHMLLVTHKYLFKQKIKGEQVITNGSSMFAEVLLLPWYLHIVEDRHYSPTTLSAESLKESVEYSNEMYQNLVPSKRLKKEQGSSEYSFGLHGCTGLSSSREISCSVAYRDINNQLLSSSATLSGSKSSINVNHGKKTQAKKVLLEFKSESICKYQVLKVGSFYIIKHQKEDMLCSLNPISHANCGKVIISSTSHLWSSLFSSNQDIFANDGPQNELLFPTSNSEFPQIQPDITIHLSNHDLEFLKDNLQRLDENIMKPLGSLKEVAKFSGITALVQSLKNLAYSYQLPEGDLISLHGKVLLVHNRGCNAKSRGKIFNATKRICIHILVDHHPARIFGSTSRYAYPVGFGPGCSADFHRILVMSGGNELIMTPSSYIEIRSLMLSAEKQCGKGLVPSDLCPSVSVDYIPSILISDALQHVGCKAVQFRCRIVAICVLLMEKNRIRVYPQTSSHPSSDVLRVPLAGFVMDDGSSSSCFWAKDELAVALLRLNKKVSHEMVVKPRGSRQNSNTVCNYLGKIVQKHGVVNVRNYGSVYDSTSQDLTVSVNPNAVISSTDDKFIKCVILNACFGTCWIVIGNLMDAHAVRKLEKRLAEMDMTMHPMQNIWVQEVHHVDPRAEARRVMQELIMS